MSYEDALLDAQLRLFMRADFDGVAPPLGQYAQVERLIERDKEAGESILALPSLSSPPLAYNLRTAPSRQPGRLYRLLMGTASARLLPGGIALALMLMVLGANASQLLRGEPGALIGGSRPTTVAEADGHGVSSRPTVVTIDEPGVKPPWSSPEINVDDPFEIRSASRRPASSVHPAYRDTIPMPSLELRPE